MASKFWDNVRDRLNAFGKTQKWLANESKVGKTVINSGISRLSSPSVDYAYSVSKVLNISIEELVDGKAGEQYLREYVREKRWQFSPPERIAEIVEAAGRLSDEQLEYVMGLIKTMLDKKEASGVPPEMKSRDKAG